MRNMFKSSWFRLVTALLLIGPAFVCQTMWEVLPERDWESASESVYARLLRFQTPAADAASRVVIIEVDQKTMDAYGWPVDREVYVSLLDRLKAAGHPWVISLLQFQALERSRSSESRDQRAAKDQALVAAIKRYDRYVGSGLKIETGAELSADQEDDLMPRVTLSRRGVAPDALPYLPLTLVEDERFVEAQRAFGYGTRFGLETPVHCTQSYITDAAHRGEFVIPSSLLWVSAFASEARFRTQSGAAWPREGEKLPFAPQRTLPVGYKLCLTSPAVDSTAFLTARGIERLSLASFLGDQTPPDLAGKVVVLAASEMRRYRGPGLAADTDDAIVPEHVLAARFLDGLLTGQIIRREDLHRNPLMAWLPFATAGLLAFGSFFLSTVGTATLAAAVLAALTAFAAINLADGLYLVPVQTMASVAASGIGLLGLYGYLRYYGMRRQVRFADSLRDALASCNTLADIEKHVRICCDREFAGGGGTRIEFSGYDKPLYEASSDPKAAVALLERRAAGQEPVESGGAFGGKLQTVLTRMGRPRGLTRHPFRALGLDVQLAVEGKLGRLGTIKISLGYLPHEEGFVADLVDILRDEVALHWHRIKLLVDQKLLDYQFLMERTRGDIMERFLTHVLVSKFSDNKTMEENLKAVLTPRATKAALLQADLRGYSRVSAKMEPLAMVRMLQGYFSNVVDVAQTVAQVKLIGDCIFLFIEEQAAPPGASPADLALELASILVRETNRQNEARAGDKAEILTFGIAIHYGDVVVGNLSSDSCIDYTVIGPNVNLVARLEELTKNEAVAASIGVNGIVLSDDARAALMKERHRSLGFLDLTLGDMGITVRSFPHIQRVSGLQASAALGVKPELVTPARLAG